MGRLPCPTRRQRIKDRSEIEAILKEHLRGIHDELASLFRGIEASLNKHLAGTEAAIAAALSREADATSRRLEEIERRLAALEAGRR